MHEGKSLHLCILFKLCTLHPSLTAVCKTIVGRLSAAVAQQSDVGVQLEALDILCDLLSRFGGLLVNYHPTLLEALYPQVRVKILLVW